MSTMASESRATITVVPANTTAPPDVAQVARDRLVGRHPGAPLGLVARDDEQQVAAEAHRQPGVAGRVGLGDPSARRRRCSASAFSAATGSSIGLL
jgi:hypothetical protein